MPGKVLFFVTEDWFFGSHFSDRAVAAKNAGYEVVVVTRVQRCGDKIRSQGLRLIPLGLRRRGINVWREFSIIRQLIRTYKSVQPNIVHHVALKPIIYGTIAAKIARVKAIVNAPVGMGYVFSSSAWKAKLIRPFIILTYRWLLNPRNGVVIVENPDDQHMLNVLRIADPKRTRLIRGAGVNLAVFTATVEPKGMPVVVLAARMLWDKGVGEFVRAASKLRSAGVGARFVLVGDTDSGNPAAIPESQLKAWQRSNDVEWWGYRDDMPAVFASSHIACLPSYREGLPKVMIEAAASGRAIVATDVPGCREIVRHGENGLLVPVRDVDALAAALNELIQDASLRQRMGSRGRGIAETEFSLDKVTAETLSVYQELLAHNQTRKLLGSAPKCLNR